jgi:hypothetical protein
MNTERLNEIYNKFPKVNLEKVELSLTGDLNRLVNALNSDISIHDRIRSQDTKIFSSLVSIMPKAKESVKTNKSVVKASNGKLDLAYKAIEKTEKAAKDLGVKPNSIKNYNEVVKLIKQAKKSQQDIIDLTKRIENLIR